MDEFDVLAERLCSSDYRVGSTAVRKTAGQEKCSDLKRCLTNIKTKTYLLQVLQSGQAPESVQDLKALKKEIHAVKKRSTQELNDIEDKAYAVEQYVRQDDIAEYQSLRKEVSRKIAEVRKASAELGVEIQGSGDDDWDWRSQNLLNNYELKAEKQRVLQLQEVLRNQEKQNELEAQLAALREEASKRNSLAACPSTANEWYEDTIATMQGFSGMEDITASGQKLHVTFSNAEDTGENSEKLMLTAFFKTSSLRDVILINAECNIQELQVDLTDIISHAVATNDFKYLIRNVKKRWQSYESLYHEVSNLRARYPVDWLMGERRLRLLCATTAKIMCVLEVSHSYPREGSISFIQVEGCHRDLVNHLSQQIQARKLTDWVDYCYSYFEKWSQSA